MNINLLLYPYIQASRRDKFYSVLASLVMDTSRHRFEAYIKQAIAQDIDLLLVCVITVNTEALIMTVFSFKSWCEFNFGYKGRVQRSPNYTSGNTDRHLPS
jgi:hypothetical protein